MRYLLQRPLPDELLGSAWIRTVRRAGLPVRTVARAVTGRKWAPGFFQAAHLPDMAALLGSEPAELLWRHTVFPYVTAFFEPAVFETALHNALATGTAATGMGAVTQSASDSVPYRRFCVLCAREDRHRHGESYWHRAHNLPGTLLCLRHLIVLRETALPSSGANAWCAALPHELCGRHLLRRRPNAFDVELARRSVAALDRDQGAPASRDALWYRARLLQLGLLSEARQVNALRLAAWFRTVAAGSPREYGLATKAWDLSWLALMVRPRSGHPFIALKHLMFEAALAVQAPVSEPRVDHVPTGPSCRDANLLDRQYAAAIRKVVATFVRQGERVRVQDALTQVGCWSAFRHSRAAFPRTATAVNALKASAAAARPNWGKSAQSASEPKEAK